jgi:hypothetical protein
LFCSLYFKIVGEDIYIFMYVDVDRFAGAPACHPHASLFESRPCFLLFQSIFEKQTLKNDVIILFQNLEFSTERRDKLETTIVLRMPCGDGGYGVRTMQDKTTGRHRTLLLAISFALIAPPPPNISVSGFGQSLVKRRSRSTSSSSKSSYAATATIVLETNDQ